MKKNHIVKLSLSAMLLALGLVLPFLTGQIPEIGSMLLPMHLPALICGFVCGWQWGIAVGFVMPIMRSLIFGMPPMIPADDRRIPGWRVVREHLAPTDGTAELRICSCCGELIHSMSSLLFDRARPEDASGEPHAITHAPEALRYGLMSRLRPPEAEEEADFFFPTPVKKGIWD